MRSPGTTRPLQPVYQRPTRHFSALGSLKRGSIRRVSRTARLAAHSGEKHNFADRLASAQDHHQAVDADADPPGGRHAVLEGAHVVLVVGLGLLVALGLVASLLLEAGALLVGIVELGEGV